jgi:hypothetical protein
LITLTESKHTEAKTKRNRRKEERRKEKRQKNGKCSFLPIWGYGSK